MSHNLEGLRISEQYEEHKIKDIPDAEVFYVPDFVDKDVAQEWYNELLTLDSCKFTTRNYVHKFEKCSRQKLCLGYAPKLKVYGREVTQSRKIATYAADPKLTLKYSGHVVDFLYEYPPLLRKIQDEVEQRLGMTFDHVMLNLYENGSVYIGRHRDNVEERVIASLSLGAPRTFIMTHDGYKPSKQTTASSHKTRSSRRSKATSNNPEEDSSSASLQRKRWTLDTGSLVVMQGETQHFWKHEIPKEPKVKDGRISLTFRRSVS